ncbi:MAG: TetR/AcrR family transcriptional regulator [Gemmatimonadota bacterium]|jgi:AcrR family transcriptional regulator
MSIQRERILSCACDLYLEDGLDGFSMRKLARSVGVTAPALYRHYESKEQVLLDVVGEAYERLAQYLYRALQGTTPAERFQMAGEGYLNFALENRRLYEVLFANPDITGMGDGSSELESRACAVGQFWNDRVRECMDAGILRVNEPEAVGVTLWSHCHGLVSLYLMGALRVDEDAFRELYMVSTRRVLQGLGTPEYGEALETNTAGGAREALAR